MRYHGGCLFLETFLFKFSSPSLTLLRQEAVSEKGKNNSVEVLSRIWNPELALHFLPCT